MGEDSQSDLVGVRVTPSRKDELEEFAEENGYDSVPSLFRRAVAHEMSDDYGRLTNQQSGGSPEQLGEAVSKVTRLQTQIEDLTEEVSMLSEEVRTDRAPEVIQRMSAIHHELPTDESEAMDAKQIAKQFDGMSDQNAWEGLMQLYDETRSVHRSTEGGWYKDPPGHDE